MTIFLYLLLALILLTGAVYALRIRLLIRYPEPARADEIHYVTTADGWHIRLTRHTAGTANAEPVLLVHGFASNHLNFELPAGSCLVDYLNERGYDCWTIDLRGCESSVPPEGLRKTSATVDGYVMDDLPAVVAYIKKETGAPRIHWIGHSMGGMLLYAYELIHGTDDLACGVTVASPLGFHDVPYASPRLALAMLRMSRGFIAGAANLGTPILMKWRPQEVKSAGGGVVRLPVNWDNLHPDITLRDALHLVDIPPHGVAKPMDGWFATKVWRMNKETVDVGVALDQLKLPLLAIFGVDDPLIPLHRAKEFVDALPTKDKKLLIRGKDHGARVDYNHVDLVFSPYSEEDVYAPVADWLKKHPVNAPKRKKKTAPKKKAAKKSAATKSAPAKKKAAAKTKAKPRKKAEAKAKTKTKTKARVKKPAVRKKSAAKRKASGSQEERS